MAKFRGTTIKLGEQDYVLPALSLGQLRTGILETLQKHDELIIAGKFYEAINVRAEVIHAALTRNYPDMPLSLVEDSLDLNDSTDIWRIVLGGSGFVAGEPIAATTEKSGA